MTLKINKIMKIEDLNKYTDQEASWLQYCGNSDTRKTEQYNDANFYDRINSGVIVYTKKLLPLPMRCAAVYITSKKPVLKSTVEELEITSDYRNHENNIYTPLEYVFATKFENSEKLIEFIRS